MKKLNKNIGVLFGISLGLSIGFPVGVLLVVFGAVKWIIALLVIGIILVVGGFYIMPIMWVKYAERKSYRRILSLIENENIYTYAELAEQTGYNDKKIRQMVQYLVTFEYLTGYLIKEEGLRINTNQKQIKVAKTNKCPNCGGIATFDGEKFVCDYCGTAEIKEQ